MQELRILPTSYSKQAYSKGRMKIKYSGYIELNDTLLLEYYKGKEHKTFNGYRLLGIDGSEIELQDGEKINKEFGRIYDNKESINASKSVVVYDLLNELVIDAELNKYNSSERASAIKQLKRIKQKGQKRKDIIIADRGFPSLELFMEMILLGYHFVLRYNVRNFLRETLPLVESQNDELEIELDILNCNNRIKNANVSRILEEGFPEKIKLRIVKIELPSGTTEYLITSILSEKNFSIDDFNKIYNLRWNEETEKGSPQGSIISPLLMNR